MIEVEQKRLPWAKKVVYFLAFVFSLIYLSWRGLYTLPWHESWFALLFGLLLWGSEIVSNFTGLLLIWNKNKAKPFEKPIVPEADYPAIDVLIATHNEEVPLLLKTVNAAVHMKYPDPKKVHIYLSDDTNRPEVKALADKFGIGYIGLTGNQHAKSGNLNHALSKTNSPLVATFDADMIPYSDFLLETVPYFVANQQERRKDQTIKPLGFVQTPQSFYNADLFQYNLFSEAAIPNEQDFFSREVNVLNNAHDTAIYTGSNTVIAREAIEAAGGFPTDTITEDFELGALINCKGYRSLSTLQPMASGLSPIDIPSALKQRIRWGRGVVQSVHNLHLFKNKTLSLAQKMVFLNSYLYWWSFLRRLLFIFAPILYTVFNVRVVETNFWVLLLFWLPSYTFLHLAMQDLSSDIRTQRWGEIQETIFAPYLVIPVFLQAIGIKETRFKVTNKAATQSKKDLLFVVPHLLLLILTIIGLVKFNYGKFGSEIFYGSVLTFWLLTHFFNLTFAVLFYLGRPIYRTTERFRAHYPVEVSDQDASYSLMTENISENGLSFVSDVPLYFPPDAQLTFKITRNGYQAEMTGNVVRVFSGKDRWVYGVALHQLSEKDYLAYLQIIYDGFNQSLPVLRDPWMTFFDSLFENLGKHLLQAKQKPLPPQRVPILTIDQKWHFDEGTYAVTTFGFDQLTLAKTEEVEMPTHLNLPISNLVLHAEKAMLQPTENQVIYQVSNLSELRFTAAFHEWVDSLLRKEADDDRDPAAI
ncbi:glycosyltransferase family 2 protein [Enterococcus innesii]|uniref:glycosyltransferase family 2 protein n=1 Tax=Enterococcus TaxID=1350 RepID=UPI000BBD2466|nr:MULTISPECIES: glycosyltransferase family 2 protein [Enterococcus]ATF71163.1 glycosyl transferase [Enterococcus sp. FDAARGOS_375]QQU20848.1 glycosyltransferase [Enterococcus casseliflavus]